MEIETEHEEKIDHIAITKNGKYFTVTSPDCVCIWELKPEVKMIKKIDLTKEYKMRDAEDDEEPLERPPPNPQQNMIAIIDNDCEQLIIYERSCLFIRVFTLDFGAMDEDEQVILTDDIDVMEVWKEENDKPLYFKDDDIIEDLYYRLENKEIRLNIK